MEEYLKECENSSQRMIIDLTELDHIEIQDKIVWSENEMNQFLQEVAMEIENQSILFSDDIDPYTSLDNEQISNLITINFSQNNENSNNFIDLRDSPQFTFSQQSLSLSNNNCFAFQTGKIPGTICNTFIPKKKY